MGQEWETVVMKYLFGGLLVAATMLTPIQPAAAKPNSQSIELAQRGDRGQQRSRSGGERRGQRSEARTEQRSERRAQQRGEARAPQSEAPRQQAQRPTERSAPATRNTYSGNNSARVDQRNSSYANRGQRRDRADSNSQPSQSRDRNRDGRVDRSYDRNRDGRVDRSYDRNRDGRVDRGYDRNRDGRVDSRYRGNSNSRSWNKQWRSDRRYDWRDYRQHNRSHYRLGRYYSPYRGYNYTRFSIGFNLWPNYYSSRYWINDPWQYRLPDAYGPYRWIRYYDDALLVNIHNGQVVDVIHDFFW